MRKNTPRKAAERIARMKKDKKSKALKIYALLTALWCVVIFAFSSQSGDESSVSSDSIVYIICEMITPKLESFTDTQRTAFVEELAFIVRKAAHFTLYFILSVFSFNALRFINNPQAESVAKKESAAQIEFVQRIKFAPYPAALGFCMFYAATDEFHQLFVQGRSGEPRDVLIDSSGALTALLICAAVEAISAKKKRKLT